MSFELSHINIATNTPFQWTSAMLPIDFTMTKNKKKSEVWSSLAALIATVSKWRKHNWLSKPAWQKGVSQRLPTWHRVPAGQHSGADKSAHVHGAPCTWCLLGHGETAALPEKGTTWKDWQAGGHPMTLLGAPECWGGGSPHILPLCSSPGPLTPQPW